MDENTRVMLFICIGALIFGLIVFGGGPFWMRRAFDKARAKEAEMKAEMMARHEAKVKAEAAQAHTDPESESAAAPES